MCCITAPPCTLSAQVAYMAKDSSFDQLHGTEMLSNTRGAEGLSNSILVVLVTLLYPSSVFSQEILHFRWVVLRQAFARFANQFNQHAGRF